MIFGAIYALVEYVVENKYYQSGKQSSNRDACYALQKYHDQYTMSPINGLNEIIRLFIAAEPSERYDRRMGELMGLLDPKDATMRFSLEEQTSLFIGMFHEKAWLYRTKEK